MKEKKASENVESLQPSIQIFLATNKKRNQ